MDKVLSAVHIKKNYEIGTNVAQYKIKQVLVWLVKKEYPEINFLN